MTVGDAPVADRSRADASPARRIDRWIIGALAVAILAGCALAGRPLSGVLAAALFWFGGAWVVRQVVRLNHDEANSVAAANAAASLPDLPEELAPILAELERARRAMAAEIEQRLRTRLSLGVAAGVLVWIWAQFGSTPPGIPVLVVNTAFGATAGYIWAAGQRPGDYRRRYKEDVLPLLVRSMDDLTYRAAVKPDAAFLREQRLFARFDRIVADDEIVGTYHGVAVSIVELSLVDTSGKSDTTVFDGLFVRIALPRTLSGITVVAADGGLLGDLRDFLGAQGGARVRMEDPEFERVYQVHATNQVSARALLTPAFMQRFLALGRRDEFALPLAIAQGNDLTVTLPKRAPRDLFEPPRYNQPADGPAAIARLHDDIAAVLNIADAILDLDQSVRKPVIPPQ